MGSLNGLRHRATNRNSAIFFSVSAFQHFSFFEPGFLNGLPFYALPPYAKASFYALRASQDKTEDKPSYAGRSAIELPIEIQLSFFSVSAFQHFSFFEGFQRPSPSSYNRNSAIFFSVSHFSVSASTGRFAIELPIEIQLSFFSFQHFSVSAFSNRRNGSRRSSPAEDRRLPSSCVFPVPRFQSRP